MTSTRTYSFKPSRPIGIWLMKLIGVAVAVNIVSSVVTYGRLRSLRYVIRVVPGSTSPPPPRLALLPQPLGAIASLVALATIVTWLVWQHRVTANVWARGHRIATRPGWAVGWWFIPIAHLWMPAVALARVYRASLASSGRPARAWIVAGWWAAYILPSLVVLGVLLPKFLHAIELATPDQTGAFTLDLTPVFRALASWTLVTVPSAIVAGVLAITIVSRIDRAQAFETSPEWIPPRPDLGPSA
jgi:uncharacterized protein DUF4328